MSSIYKHVIFKIEMISLEIAFVLTLLFWVIIIYMISNYRAVLNAKYILPTYHDYKRKILNKDI
jgi:hypothetical protein